MPSVCLEQIAEFFGLGGRFMVKPRAEIGRAHV